MGASISIVSIKSPTFSISLQQGNRKQSFEPNASTQPCTPEFVLQDSLTPCPNNSLKLYHGGRLVMEIWEHDWTIRFRVAQQDFKSSKVISAGHSRYSLSVNSDGGLEFVDCAGSWRFAPGVTLNDHPPQYKQSPSVTVHVAAVEGEVSLDAAIQQAEQKAEQELKSEKVRILVLGPSGAGKSSLISMVFPYLKQPPKSGMGTPVTEFKDIDRVWTDEEGKMPVLCHDSQGLELANTDILARLKKWIQKKALEPKLGDRLHVVWYTLPLAGGIRLQPADIELIKFIDSLKIPVFLVLTFSDQKKEGGEEALRKAIEENLPKIPRGIFTTSTIPVRRKTATQCPACGSDDIQYRHKAQKYSCSECKVEWQTDFEYTHQLVELVDATTNSFTDETIRTAFATAQTVSLQSKLTQSVILIATSVAASVTIGANPIPFSDALLLIPLEFTLINGLAYIWNIQISLKSLVGLGLTQVLFSQTVAVGLASFLKIMYGAGTVAGGVINGAVAGTLTLAIGIVYATGFYMACKKGWIRQSEQQLLENLRTVINGSRFENVHRAVGSMLLVGMSPAIVRSAAEEHIRAGVEQEEVVGLPPGGPPMVEFKKT